jgi:hypothetical protein
MSDEVTYRYLPSDLALAIDVVTLRVIFRWEEERVTRLVEYALDEAEKGAPIK